MTYATIWQDLSCALTLSKYLPTRVSEEPCPGVDK